MDLLNSTMDRFEYHPPVWGKQKILVKMPEFYSKEENGYSNSNGDTDWLEKEAHYLCEMEKILGPWEGSAPPTVPTKLLPHLYLGGRKELKDINHLKRLGITHILNCAGTQPFTVYDLSKDSDMKMYAQFYSLDNASYPVLDHFSDARSFIDRARLDGGKAFVHCQMGVNRSATICAAYIMVDEQLDLLSTVEMMQKKRGLTLVNYNFRRQLVEFARNRGLLEKISEHRNQIRSGLM